MNLASNDAEAQEVEFRQQVGPTLLGGNGEQKEACAGQESRVKKSWTLTPMIVKAIPFLLKYCEENNTLDGCAMRLFNSMIDSVGTPFSHGKQCIASEHVT